MAAYTSTQTGNWSATSTWGGSGPPAAGDTATIANGHVVTVNVNTTVGSNASGVGHAVTINGASSGSFGTLQVAGGVTLTLRGFDAANNTMMLINRYGTFAPQPGSTIVGDIAGDYASIIKNNGIISAIGSSGSHITFKQPDANVSWSNAVTGEANNNSGLTYDPNSSIAITNMAHDWIANAANTGIGSFGDSSMSFAGQSPATIMATEVATLAAVNGTGKYYVDYNCGFIYFYHVYSAGAAIFTSSYKYGTFTKGWGIVSSGNTSYNAALFNYCDFLHVGGGGGNTYALDLQNHLSAGANGSATDRIAYVTNCTFTRCVKAVQLGCTGTAGDPIQFTGNTFTGIRGDNAYGSVLTCWRVVSSYLNVAGNIARGNFPFLTLMVYGGPTDFTGWTITGNTWTGGYFLYCTSDQTRMPGTTFSGNTLNGVGWCLDYRTLFGVCGSPTTNVTITGNLFAYCSRSLNYGSYVTFTDNLVYLSLHHSVIPSGSDQRLSNVTITNNLFFGVAPNNGNGSPTDTNCSLGYNQRQWLDNIVVANNTMVNDATGWFGFGDCAGDFPCLATITRTSVVNNLAKMVTSTGSIGARRRADDATDVTRIHCYQFDYNLDHNYATRYSGLSQQGTFALGGSNYNTQAAGVRNVAGVALFDPSFSSKSGGSLALTYTSATNRTLTWGAGTPVQIVLDSGTCSSASAANSTNGLTIGATLNDTAKTWSTTKNNVGCPAGCWVVITGGAGAGQIAMITNNTATQLTVVPVTLNATNGWTTPLSTSSTYAIIKPEVVLTDGAESVHAGVYLPDLPGSTKSDTGISFADHSVTGSDPLLTTPSGALLSTFALTAAQYKLSSSSPAKDAGVATNAPGVDYFGTARPQGSAVDIGFYELQAGSMPLVGGGLVSSDLTTKRLIL